MEEENKAPVKQNILNYLPWILLCLLSIVMLTSAIVYFNMTDKFNDKQLAKLDVKQQELKPLIEQAQNEVPVIPNAPISIVTKEKSCAAFSSFILDYHHMRVQAYDGRNFSESLLNLKHYNIANAEIAQSLASLSDAASLNVENESLKSL